MYSGMDIPIALLLPVPNLIVQILLVLALSLLWCTFISTPFGVQEYVRTPLSLSPHHWQAQIFELLFIDTRFGYTLSSLLAL